MGISLGNDPVTHRKSHSRPLTNTYIITVIGSRIDDVIAVVLRNKRITVVTQYVYCSVGVVNTHTPTRTRAHTRAHTLLAITTITITRLLRATIA